MRPVWVRGLTLYRAGEGSPSRRLDGPVPAERIHARSRFRHVDDLDCYAVYSVRDVPSASAPAPLLETEHHTLVTVREFRRVPLDASGLALMLFSARAGRAAEVIATLALWVERAVSLYQPTYLLFAHSLEQPAVSALLAGVRAGWALQWAWSSPFSVEPVLRELRPLLDGPPAHYAYCPDVEARRSEDAALAELPRIVSPSAV